jgi:tetratricopeptide (TPR) repeat protein
MMMTTPEQLMEAALAHHQAGEFADAESLYRAIIGANSRDAAALHLFGALQHQKGNNGAAIALIRRSLDIRETPEAWYNLGHVLRLENLLDEAIIAWQKALDLQPNHRDAAFNLAKLVGEAGPPEAALVAWKGVVAIAPTFAPAWFNLGNTLHRQKHYAEAAEALKRTVELTPDFAEAWANFAVSLKEAGDFTQAEAAARRAISLEPTRPQWLSNLGTVLHDQHHIAEALACAKRAVEIDPTFAEGWCNLGVVLHDLKRPKEAITACERGLALAPDHAVMHKNYAFALMLDGQLERGWKEYEWRWKAPFVALDLRSFTAPRWDGKPFPGKTLLIHAEQGQGDTLQYIRYASQAAALGGRVVIECQPSLVRLLRSLKGVDQVVGRGDPLPPFDLHCPTMSLPNTLGVSLENIPDKVPYVRPSVEAMEIWARRLGPKDGRLRVGLCWSGEPRKHVPHATAVNERRSIRLSQLVPLAQIPNIRWISLQKGAGAAQIAESPFPIEDFMDGAKDFSDTAALIANLDLVISVDTAVAHLAGALGHKTWLLACSDACWRWLMERSDSPWYPSMRLFRQSSWNDWTGVVGELGAAFSTTP